MRWAGAATLVVGFFSILLLIGSSVAEGMGASAAFASSAALLGVALGFGMPFIRAIFVDTFKRPTRRTVVSERHDGNGTGVTVEIVGDGDDAPLARPPVRH